MQHLPVVPWGLTAIVLGKQPAHRPLEYRTRSCPVGLEQPLLQPWLVEGSLTVQVCWPFAEKALVGPGQG